MKAPLFYRAYDALYAAKDYAGEVSALLSAFRGRTGREPERVLEIGCGTGNHTRLLARRCGGVLAVETDPFMAAMAREKIKGEGIGNARVEECRVEELSGRGFGLACALFHVVTYLADPRTLESFFSAVCERLDPAGLFFFDAWNGVAALREPPRRESRRLAWGEKEIRLDIVPENDLLAQKSSLTYRLGVFSADGGLLEEACHGFDQNLWTPREICAALSAAGFSKISVHPAFDLSRPAVPEDFRVLFMAEKAGQ